jgi:hypothetical protein
MELTQYLTPLPLQVAVVAVVSLVLVAQVVQAAAEPVLDSQQAEPVQLIKVTQAEPEHRIKTQVAAAEPAR